MLATQAMRTQGRVDPASVAAARSAEAVHRELPFTCRMDGKLISGRIALAYRMDGAGTLIDFKTARPSDSAQVAERYRDQMHRYRTAVATLAGSPWARPSASYEPGAPV